MGTMTIDRIRPNQAGIQSYPLWNGSHDKGLSAEAD
jgi:hypothetical protein